MNAGNHFLPFFLTIVLMLFVYAFFLEGTYQDIAHIYEVRNWNRTQGTVKEIFTKTDSSRITVSKRDVSVWVLYSFEVNAKKFINVEKVEEYGNHPMSSPDEDLISKAKENFTQHSTVFYEPANPEHSCIKEPQNPSGPILWGLLGLTIEILIVMWMIRKFRKSKNNGSGIGDPTYEVPKS